MLHSAGLPSVEIIDVTSEFRLTVHGLLVERDRYEKEVRALSGQKVFAEKQSKLGGILKAIDEGLLMRSLCLAH